MSTPRTRAEEARNKLRRMALAEARRMNPGYSSEDLQDEVEDILRDWAREAAHDAELRGDTEHLENGVHNCDDFGTGEGRYHGRI